MSNEEELIVESVNANVGIFWWYKEQLITFMQPVENVKPDVLGFVNPPLDHDAVWNKVVAQHPELRNKEYYDIPRGRIVYNTKDQKFRLVSNNEILQKSFLVYRIAREFHVPPKRMTLVYDQHYEREADFGDDEE